MSKLSPGEWDSKFNAWTQGPAETEQERCHNAQRMVRDAINSYPQLSGRKIEVFLQGSYRNRTNVRKESDVDVCVLCKDSFFNDYSYVQGVTNSTLNYQDAIYTLSDLKRDVGAALITHFGRQFVKPGDKAFNVKENSYRVTADAVPTFENRMYYRNSNGLAYHSGTILQSTHNNALIRNWPEQHYANGVNKHEQTAKQFKKKVRCLKNLCNEMAACGIASAQAMPSFLVESLVYNCPDSVFAQITHYDDMKEIIRYLHHNTKTDEGVKAMIEVNGIKYLFHPSQPWSRNTANKFILDSWHYVGFKE